MQASSSSERPKLITFYLPQFHPIPENDAWWGKGFTEWRNVTRAKPLYRGHYQPHLPADLGFYDLRLPEVREEQAALAKQYGIYGFCYYYYWFNGRRILERPLEEVLKSGKPDFPFCICWANENWSRRWDGSEHEILLAQEHTHQTDERFILDILPILKDSRYITVSGKPMLLVYRVDLLPRPSETANTWRSVAAANGIPDLHLCSVQSFGTTDPRPQGFDAAVEFPPLGLMRGDMESQVSGLALQFSGSILDYRETARWALSRPVPDYQLHRAVMVAWDNSPRRGTRGYIFEHATPESYYKWLSELVCDSRTRAGASEFIFINAWNEWAEGAHLEPDLKYGHAYLETTRRALATELCIEPQHLGGSGQDQPLVSVVIRSHNDARFVQQAIASVENQTYKNIELVVIDDGSSDGSVAIIERMLPETRLQRVTFRTQPELGAGASMDRGIMLSSGDYVAILNADAAFEPGRVEKFVQRVGAGDGVFLFSGITFYCDRAKRVIGNEEPDARIRSYKNALRLAALAPTAGFALLGADLTVSTSNFFMSRALFEKLSGFSNELPLVTGWDFVLRATRYCEPEFVPDELLILRCRDCQACSDLEDQYLHEARTALARFIDFTSGTTLNTLAPTQRNWPVFFDFFCSRVTPWFASTPLIEHLPVAEASRNATGQGEFLRAHENAAIQGLQEGLEATWYSPAPVASVREQIAQKWSHMVRVPAPSAG